MFEIILAKNCQTFDNINFEFSMSHHNAHYQSYKNAPKVQSQLEAITQSPSMSILIVRFPLFDFHRASSITICFSVLLIFPFPRLTKADHTWSDWAIDRLQDLWGIDFAHILSSFPSGGSDNPCHQRFFIVFHLRYKYFPPLFEDVVRKIVALWDVNTAHIWTLAC